MTNNQRPQPDMVVWGKWRQEAEAEFHEWAKRHPDAVTYGMYTYCMRLFAQGYMRARYREWFDHWIDEQVTEFNQQLENIEGDSDGIDD